MKASSIKTDSELNIEINTLVDSMDLMKRKRTELSQNINKHRKQIIKLQEILINNNQYELYQDEK